MEKIIKFFIRNEVLVNLCILLIIVFGVISAMRLTSSFFPEQDVKFIKVEAIYPGASPEEVEEGITLKVEDNLTGISGVDRITSTSSENSAIINVELLPRANPNNVLQEVKNAVDRISSFPPEMERIVVFKQENTNFTARIALSGDVPLSALKASAQEVEDDLRDFPNISKITLSGYTNEQIEIAVRENTLRAYEITFQELAEAVRGENLSVTGGRIRGKNEELIIRADHKQYYADKLGDIIVKSTPDGEVVRLSELANIKESWSEDTDRVFFNGTQAVIIQVNTTNEEDILAAAESIRNYVEGYNSQSPQIEATIVRDYTDTLRERLGLLEENGAIGAALVVIMLGAFLRLRLAFWVALGIPVSFLGMFVLGAFYGLTINVLSLFGMILVVGILVDDGVVVGENIFQHYEDGEPPLQAAVNGTMEVMPSVLAAILTTSVAFGFFMLIEGQLGEFYSDVAFVVIASLVISFVEVIFFLPAHLAHSRDLKEKNREKESKNKLKEKVANYMFIFRDRVYLPVLKFVMRYKVFYFAACVAVVAITIGAVAGGVIQTTFFPQIEQNRINVSLQMPAGTPDVVTERYLDQIQQEAIALNKEYVQDSEDSLDAIEDTELVLGPGSNKGQLTLYLSGADKRSVRSFNIASDLRERSPDIPLAEKLTFKTESPFGKPVSISLSGEDYEELRAAKQALRKELQQLETLRDVTDTDQEDQPEVQLELLEKGRLLGLNLRQVIGQVRNSFFGQEVQRLQRGIDEVKVWVRYNLGNRDDLQDLREMRIRTQQGGEYPLEEIASFKLQPGLIAINHKNGQREIKVEAEVASLEVSAPDLIQRIRENILPGVLGKFPGVDATFEGQYRETRKLANSTQQAGPVVLIIMFALLVLAFRSFSQAFALILVIPFGMVGAAWGHYIHGLPVSILSALGFVALIGILFNDGLVFVNTFNSELKKGTPFSEGLVKTGLSRFRPLVLTTITTAAGLAPLIFETSFQAQFLIPMAVTVAYGLLVGSFLLATVLPVLLYAFNRVKIYSSWLWEGHKPAPEAVERAVKEQKEKEIFS